MLYMHVFTYGHMLSDLTHKIVSLDIRKDILAVSVGQTGAWIGTLNVE